MSESAPSKPSSTTSVAGDGRERPIHAISVDVEDWFQVWALSSVIGRDDWDGYDLRVTAATNRLLDLFAEHDAKATFFILGWVAERTPDLIRRMADEGHEVASHGWDHTKVFDQSPEEFREDIRKTKATLEDIAGVPVTGFRAAGFSIDRRTLFAYEILREEGYRYSSSTHPIAHDHYGDPHAPLTPFMAEGALTEIPVAVREAFGRRLSCAGGGWFRAMPYALSRYMWRRLEKEARKGVFYFHPWEIDPGQPSVDGLPLKSRLRHRLNLGAMEAKVTRLLKDFRWGRIDEVFEEEIGADTGQRAVA